MAVFPTRQTLSIILASTLAMGLTACGAQPRPVAGVLPTSIASTQVRPFSAQATTHTFGLKFNAQTPHVRFTPGTINSGLPSRVDLRSAQTPIRDQGAIGSCTGFAISALAEYTEKQQHRQGTLSPAFIYTLELQKEGNLGQDAGAEIHDGIDILNKQGIATEGTMPYLAAAEQQSPDQINQFLSVLPSAEAMKEALGHRVTSVKPVNDLNAFKAALAKGHPVVFGIPVYSSIEQPGVAKTGIFPVPDTEKETLLGGHALLAVGYDDQKQQIIFKNSWTTGWGDHGFGYLPYGFFAKDLVMDSWQAG